MTRSSAGRARALTRGRPRLCAGVRIPCFRATECANGRLRAYANEATIGGLAPARRIRSSCARSIARRRATKSAIRSCSPACRARRRIRRSTCGELRAGPRLVAVVGVAILDVMTKKTHRSSHGRSCRRPFVHGRCLGLRRARSVVRLRHRLRAVSRLLQLGLRRGRVPDPLRGAGGQQRPLPGRGRRLRELHRRELVPVDDVRLPELQRHRSVAT